jgi:hypothetical protein
MELHKVYWRQKAGTQSTEVRSPVSKSFLYLWPCYLWGFSENYKSSYLAQQKTYSVCTVFFISVYFGLKCCPSLLDVTGIRVLPRNFSNSSLFTAIAKNIPSARRGSADKYLCKDVDVSRKTTDSLKQNLRYFVAFLHQFKTFSWGLGFFPSTFYM